MSSLPKPYYTPEQYLESERHADDRSEYLSGQIFGMAGGSPRHNAITVNVVSEFRSQFRGRPCQAFASDLRVKVMETGLYTYPDVVAVCGRQEFDPLDANTLINPAVIVGVLSKSTEGYDRGEKFTHYRRIPSLTDYVMIAQDRVSVEHFVRQLDGRWLLAELNGLGDRVLLPHIGCELAVSEIYDKIEFGPPAPDAS